MNHVPGIHEIASVSNWDEQHGGPTRRVCWDQPPIGTQQFHDFTAHEGIPIDLSNETKHRYRLLITNTHNGLRYRIISRRIMYFYIYWPGKRFRHP